MYFEVDKKKGSRVTLRNIPQYGVKILTKYNFVYDANSFHATVTLAVIGL